MSGKKKQESTILPSVCPPHSSGLLSHNKYAASSSSTGNLGKLYSSSPFKEMAVKSFVGAFEVPSPTQINRLVVVEPVKFRTCNVKGCTKKKKEKCNILDKK